MSKEEELLRVSTKALPATPISGSMGHELQTSRRSTPASGSLATSGALEVVRLRIAASGSVAISGDLRNVSNKIAASGSVASSGSLETVRLRIAASGSVAISGDLKNVSNKIAVSGSLVQSGEVPDKDWRQKVNPNSGGGVAASAGAGAETFGAWVNIVVAPAQDFEIVKIEALIKQKDQYYFEYGKSGQSDTDISHLSVQESGTVVIDTLNPPHRYGSGDNISVRTKSELGSGIGSTIWVFTREPT